MHDAQNSTTESKSQASEQKSSGVEIGEKAVEPSLNSRPDALAQRKLINMASNSSVQRKAAEYHGIAQAFTSSLKKANPSRPVGQGKPRTATSTRNGFDGKVATSTKPKNKTISSSGKNIVQRLAHIPISSGRGVVQMKKGVQSGDWGANKVATWKGGVLQAPFTNTIYFNADDNSSYSYAEFRQYVKGSFKVDGTPIVHSLGAAGNLDGTFKEDGPGQYGHRSNAANPKDKYTNPNQTTGKKFYMEDEPGIRGDPGEKVEIDLQFKGVVIDTTDGNKVLEEKRWTVKGKKTVPQ